MSDKPDFRAQFKEPKRERVYMGGVTASCGDHPSLPKRHRWSAPRKYQTGARTWYDRMCLNCALCEDFSPTPARSLYREDR